MSRLMWWYAILQDYALGMNIKAKGLHSVYVHETLGKGDAPLRVVDSFIQRRRWAMVCSQQPACALHP